MSCRWVDLVRGGKSGRFREFNSQKIFSKTRFDRKYLRKYHRIASFANHNSRIMLFSNKISKKKAFLFVFILYTGLEPCPNLYKFAENNCFDTRLTERKIFFPPLFRGVMTL